MSTGGYELRGLATRRGAQIGDAAPTNIAEQTHRQGGGGVLNPPRAFIESGKCRDRAMRQHAHRATRQDTTTQFCRPGFRLALHRQIERRLMAVSRRNGMRGRGAVMLRPAREKPWRRVENGPIE